MILPSVANSYSFYSIARLMLVDQKIHVSVFVRRSTWINTLGMNGYEGIDRLQDALAKCGPAFATVTVRVLKLPGCSIRVVRVEGRKEELSEEELPTNRNFPPPLLSPLRRYSKRHACRLSHYFADVRTSHSSSFSFPSLPPYPLPTV